MSVARSAPRAAPRVVCRAAFRRLRAVAIPVLAVATLAAPAAARAQRAAGAAPAPGPAAANTAELRYAFRVQTGEGDPVRGVTYVSGGRSRIELLDDDGRPRRDYLLVTDDGRTFTAVHPDDRAYSETSADDFARIMTTAMDAATSVMTLDVHELRVGGRRLGAGERVAGQATERSRLVADFGLRIGALGFTKRQRHHVEVEYLVAPALALPRNPLLELFAAVPTALAQADRDFVTRMRAGRDALVGSGTPLRVAVTTRTEDEEGTSTTKRSTIEVTEVVRGAQPPSRFTVPDGYRKRDGFTFSTGSK